MMLTTFAKLFDMGNAFGLGFHDFPSCILTDGLHVPDCDTEALSGAAHRLTVPTKSLARTFLYLCLEVV